MEKCSFASCNKPATHAPKIFVPATGHPRIEKGSINALMGVKLCLKHCKSFPARDQFFNDMRDTWREVFLMSARLSVQHSTGNINAEPIPPDYDRAWVVPVELTSADFISFEAMTATKQ